MTYIRHNKRSTSCLCRPFPTSSGQRVELNNLGEACFKRVCARRPRSALAALTPLMMPRVGLLKYLFVSPFLFLFCLVSSCPRFFEFEPRTRPIQTHMARSQCCGYRKLYVAPGRTKKSLSPFSLSLSLHCSVRLVVPSFHHPGSDCDISLYPFLFVFSTRRALVSSPRVGLQKYLSLPYFSSLVVSLSLIPFSRLVVSSSLRPGSDCEMSLSLFFVLLAVRSAVSAVAKGAGRWAVAGHALVLRHARGEGPSSMPPALACPAAASGVPSDVVVRVAHGVAPLGLVEARRKRWRPPVRAVERAQQGRHPFLSRHRRRHRLPRPAAVSAPAAAPPAAVGACVASAEWRAAGPLRRGEGRGGVARGVARGAQ